MADEITVSGSLQFLKAPMLVQVALQLTREQFDLSGSTLYVQGVVSVPFAAPAAIPLGSVATPGWTFIRNLDATNYIEIYTAAGGVALPKLLPGEIFLARLGVAAPAWKANVAACLVEYLIIEA